MTSDQSRPLSPKSRWRAEMTAAFLARAVAARESDSKFRALFQALAAEGEEQAAIIAKTAGLGAPRFRPSARSRIVAAITRAAGPRAARPLLAASKVRGLSVYGAPLAAPGHPMPTAVESIGRRHAGTGGGALRAAVFGINDGLVSNTSLVMGVAGAGAAGETILLAGAAGLLAGAFSMAAGEFVSMRTQREMYEHQIAQEREELSLYPDEEAEELALIYEARGVPLGDARIFAQRLVSDPNTALDALAREELGLNPADLGSPSRAALFSFLSFALGAAVPLPPFLLGAGESAIPAAAILAGIALFAVGAALSLYSGRGAIVGGARMLTIGAAAALATFAVGRLLGVAIP
jgi:VIT1/CCC1 family predicted Fe2+/Mn2+ transporter